jgi:hypothetical protein
MQKQPYSVNVRISVEMINAASIKRGGTPDNAVDFISFGQQQLSQIRTILTGNPGNKSFLQF